MHPIILPLAELKSALPGLGKAINRHATLPVLRSIKIERRADGWTSLIGTDLDRFISVRLEQPIPGDPLALLVPYEQLVSLTKACGKDERLVLEPGPDHSTVIKFALASQQGEARTPPLPVDEFPPVPRFHGEAIALPDSARHALLEAMQCCSTDESRAILQGALLDVSKPDAHYVVATDGRHLYSSNSFRFPLRQSLVIPSHRFLAWREFHRDGNWELRVAGEPESKSKTAPLVQISSRRWRYITRQIEGPYPNWRQVVPDPKPRTSITLDPGAVEDLIQVIGRMPCHDERHHSLGLEWKDRRLQLLGKQEPADPWTRVPVPAVKGDGRDCTVFMDRRLLVKALQFGLNTLGILDEISPLRFSQGGRQMIVMPHRDEGPAPSAAPPPPQVHPRSHVPAPAPPQPQPRPQATSTPKPPPPPGRAAEPSASPTLEHVIDAVHHVRESFQSGITKLRDLSLQLRHLHREQRTSSREMRSVRSTLRSLQGLKL